MKKRRILIITAIVLIIIVAVAAAVILGMSGGSHTGIDNEPEAEVKGESNILVAYFSWSGNGQQMAEWIADETGGERFRIVPEVSYGEDYGDCADRAKEELDGGIRPALSAHVDPDVMARMEIIYLGFPVWWYDLPMPVWTFLEEYDFSGKTVIPFFSHNGSSNGANSLNRIQELIPDAEVLTDSALSVRGSSVSGSESEIREWAAGFGGISRVSDISRAPDNTEEPSQSVSREEQAASVVYFTADISSEGMMAVYKALGWTPSGNVAVKLSTGEPPASNYLRPELIQELVQSVEGTIVECNTAYGGSRTETAMHMQVAEDHGFTAIADVDILDAEGSAELPVEGGSYLETNYVGSHFTDYDSYIVLSHFKGHAMAGFGGAIKNISIGLGSKEGKCVIHTGGQSHTSPWGGDQTAFTESMAEAGKSVSDYLGNGEWIIYISVLNNISIDCDCNGNPAEPDIHDIGILASTDPVAIDQAAVDLCFAAEGSESLQQRVERQNGLHTLEHAEEIGLGSRTYDLVNIDE